MASIREKATLTSKGQITLPRSIRQALGVTTGGKIEFELRGDDIVVTRASTGHEDPAIGAFLSLLETDIRGGQNIGPLPENLVRAMEASLDAPSNHADEEIEGEVDL
ncbi:MAG: type II toxin-antitoxin system PrlF family antitoxin [Halospina sp.]